jgi:hypothetical protein
VSAVPLLVMAPMTLAADRPSTAAAPAASVPSIWTFLTNIAVANLSAWVIAPRATSG